MHRWTRLTLSVLAIVTTLGGTTGPLWTGEAPKAPTPRPSRITAADVRHLVAYYRARQRRLLVFNQKALANGIERGVYRVAWKPGASKATVSILQSRPAPKGKDVIVSVRIIADVVLGQSPGGLVGTTPAIGDTQLVEFKKKVDHAEYIGMCASFAGGPKNTKADRGVYREYVTLEDDGDQSGTTTYLAVARRYYYALLDCSRGYLGSEDFSSEYVLSAGAWPNP